MRRLRGSRHLLGGLLGGAALLGLAAATASAESAWVRGEVRLNLRTGPSTGNRILGGVKTGDKVEILQRGEDWTQVRDADGTEGWIPAGYLDPQPPATVQLEDLQTEAQQLRERVGTLSQENDRLQRENQEAVKTATTQRAEIDRLTDENRSLKAGARWPHWIAGASILSVGMVAGAILARTSGRRSPRRIKL